MEKKWKYLLTCGVLCFVSVVSLGLSIFLPKNTKADKNNFSQYANQVSVSAEETGASTASSSEKGGAIFITNNSTFTLTGGVIQGHNKRYGGAVYVCAGSTFTMKGGEISSNIAQYGGAIYVEDGATCNIEGGVITKNFAEGGCAIYVENGGVLNISKEAVIRDNSRSSTGLTIDYYVDGVLKATDYVDDEENIFKVNGAPYSYENTCGFYLDEEMTYAIEDGQEILPYVAESESATFTASEKDQSKAYLNEEGHLSLYTKIATPEYLDFVVSGDYYLASLKEGSAGDICVPREYQQEGVTLPVKLNNDAFKDSLVNKVYLPASVDRIPDNAFKNSSLTYVNLPESIIALGEYAFYDTFLTNITVSGKISEIPGYFIYNESSAVSITLEDGVEVLCSNAICDGLKIQELKLPSTLKTINSKAFGNFESSNLEVRNLVIPEGVTNIVEKAFNGCEHLTKITLPGTLINIDTNMFNNCINLNTITLSEGIVSANLLSNMQYVTQVNYPSTLKNVENFYYSGSEIIIPEGIETLGQTVLGTAENDKVTKIVFPQSVKALSADILKPFKNLTELTLPGAEKIKASWFGTTKGTGSTAVRTYYNPKLAKVTILEGAKEIEAYAFKNHSVSTFVLPSTLETVGECAFYQNWGVYKVTSINIQDTSLKTIGSRAFSNLGVTSLVFPETLETIGDRAFQNSNFSGKLIIPKSVNKIETLAFEVSKISELVCLSEGVIDYAAFRITTLRKAFISGENVNYSQNLFNVKAAGEETCNINVYCSADYNIWKNNWANNVENVIYGCPYENYSRLSENTVINGVWVAQIGVTTPNCNLSSIKKLVLPTTATSLVGTLENVKTIIVNGDISALDNAELYANGNDLSKIVYNGTMSDSLKAYIQDHPKSAMSFGATSWQDEVYDGQTVLTREYGDGTENNPFVISSVEQYNLMINQFAKEQFIYDSSSTFEQIDFGSIVVDFKIDANGEKTVLSVYPNKKYFKLSNNIDFMGAEPQAIGDWASISLDGNGFGLINMDGEYLESAGHNGALIKNGYDMEFKNLNISTQDKMVVLCSLIRGGNNTFESVNILPTMSGGSIQVNADDKNESMYMGHFYNGTLNFISCHNYADYMALAPYFGVFMGGYTVNKNSVVNFYGCENYGDIFTTGVTGIFFGNGNRRPGEYTLKHCVNWGNITYESVSGQESHILAAKTSGSPEFYNDEFVNLKSLSYDGFVAGEIMQYGEIFLHQSDIIGSVIDNTSLQITNVTGNLVNGTYELYLNPATSFAPADGSNDSWNTRILQTYEISDVSSYTFTNVLLSFVDLESYINKGYSTDNLDWVTVETTSGDYRYTKADNYYVFDFNGEWIMPEKWSYKTVQYTLVLRDENGNILDFIRGALDLTEYHASIENSNEATES